MISSIILLIIAVLFLIITFKVIKSLIGLAINAVFGVVLFFIANAIDITNIQISPFNLLVCAIGGVPGALLLIILNVLGVY
jgi:hypothetical protein